MDTDRERLERLEKVVLRLAEEVVALKRSEYFAHVVAGQAMFTHSRILPWLEKANVIASGDAGIVATTHAIFLKHEQNPDFEDRDRKTAETWRAQLGREG